MKAQRELLKERKKALSLKHLNRIWVTKSMSDHTRNNEVLLLCPNHEIFFRSSVGMETQNRILMSGSSDIGISQTASIESGCDHIFTMESVKTEKEIYA